MNTTRQFAAALATALFAAAGSSAFATEAEQFVPPAPTQSRAQVVSELKAAIARGDLLFADESFQGVDRNVVSTRARADVKAEARYAVRHPVFNEYDIGG